jgi:uncharacterized membrane protein YciS (DUF1049 family)
MDETETSFWQKKPEELNVADQLKLVALIPAVMVAGFVAPAIVINAVESIRTRLRNRKLRPELTLVETTDEEVQ